MSKSLFFMATIIAAGTLSGCSDSAMPARDNFYNNFTYYNDGIKPRAVSANASFYPTSAVR